MVGKTRKSTPLPSVLSSIRRAGAVVTGGISDAAAARSPDASASTAAERESFLSAISTADGPIAIPSHHHQQQHGRPKFKPFNLTASGDFGFRGKDKKDATGKKFRVQIPQKMLFYVALVFFVIPMLSAVTVLIRTMIGEDSNDHGVVKKVRDGEGSVTSAEDLLNNLSPSDLVLDEKVALDGFDTTIQANKNTTEITEGTVEDEPLLDTKTTEETDEKINAVPEEEKVEDEFTEKKGDVVNDAKDEEDENQQLMQKYIEKKEQEEEAEEELETNDSPNSKMVSTSSSARTSQDGAIDTNDDENDNSVGNGEAVGEETDTTVVNAEREEEEEEEEEKEKGAKERRRFLTLSFTAEEKSMTKKGNGNSNLDLEQRHEENGVATHFLRGEQLRHQQREKISYI